MDAKAGEYRHSELPSLDVTISVRYHWSVARQLTPTSLESQESYLTTGMLPNKHSSFFLPTHGSIMLPPRQPHVFARLACWQKRAAVFYRSTKPRGVFYSDKTRAASFLNGFKNIPQKVCLLGVQTKDQIVSGKC